MIATDNVRKEDLESGPFIIAEVAKSPGIERTCHIAMSFEIVPVKLCTSRTRSRYLPRLGSRHHARQILRSYRLALSVVGSEALAQNL